MPESTTVCCRVNTAERELLAITAASEGLTLSTWLRDVALKVAQQELSELSDHERQQLRATYRATQDRARTASQRRRDVASLLVHGDET